MTFEPRASPLNKARAIWLPPRTVLILHSHLHPAFLWSDSGSRVLSAPGDRRQGQIAEDRPLLPLGGGLRHAEAAPCLAQVRRGGRKWVSWPRCITGTLSSVCPSQLCAVQGSLLFPEAHPVHTEMAARAQGPAAPVCLGPPWFQRRKPRVQAEHPGPGTRDSWPP